MSHCLFSNLIFCKNFQNVTFLVFYPRNRYMETVTTRLCCCRHQKMLSQLYLLYTMAGFEPAPSVLEADAMSIDVYILVIQYTYLWSFGYVVPRNICHVTSLYLPRLFSAQVWAEFPRIVFVKVAARVARWFVFKTKNPNLGKWKWKIVAYFMTVWFILRPLEIFYGHLV
jgi:hypothetical protein